MASVVSVEKNAKAMSSFFTCRVRIGGAGTHGSVIFHRGAMLGSAKIASRNTAAAAIPARGAGDLVRLADFELVEDRERLLERDELLVGPVVRGVRPRDRHLAQPPQRRLEK